MDSSVVLNEVVEFMKCSNCKGYLRPPINYCSDGRNICGSCKEVVDSTTIVGINKDMESIGANLNFPCKYFMNNCTSKLSWKDLEVHEKGCPNRQFTCPSCPTWNGAVAKIMEHVLSQHEVQTADIILSIDSNKESVLHLQVIRDVYFLFLNCDSDAGLIWFNMKSIKSLDQTKKTYFKVTISANETTYVVFQPIEYASNWKLNEEAAIKVDICVLKIKLKMKSESVIKVKFDILTREPIYNGSTNENLLTDLECPVCHEYMTAPIYQCAVGHSICNYCKPKLQFCASCRSLFSASIRNFTLESISNKLHYKCMYVEQGCEFTALPAQIQHHELTCDYGYFDCPVKDFMNCSWRGRLDQMSSHALEEHGFKF